jgi:hypothetical protein
MLQQIGTYLQKQFSLDTRALSWMRICLGLVLMADWIIRLNSLTAHYTNAGVLPQDILFNYQWKEGYYSLFVFSDSLGWQYFLFFMAILFSFFFTIGYFTRFSNLIVWILICSVHARNPFILQGGDELLRLTLFWALFLPLDRKYSVDALHKKENAGDTGVFSMAGFGFMFLVFGVYFFSVLQKTSSEWHSQGTAIYYALSLDQMVLPLGKVLLNQPGLCKVLTHVVFYTELLAPILFFIPWKNQFFRTAAIILLIVMHFGISFTLFVGLFFLIGISTLVGMLPASFIDWKLSKLPAFLKKIRPDLFFARYLPAFNTIRNVYAGIIRKISNFYSITILSFSLLFVICVCIIWNLGNIPGTGLTVTGPFRTMAFFLRLEENWGMFSPGVFKDDGWFVLEGTEYVTNNKVDLYRNKTSVSYEKPENVLSEIEDDRWRKFGENYIMVSYSYMRPAWCNYMLKKWNSEHSKNRIRSLQVIYMKETTLPNYQKPKVTKEVLCTCNE